MYRVWGKVKKGNKRGGKMGFPTANINLLKNIPEGIYVSKTKIQKIIYPSITFIGRAITFNETKLQAETHLFSFNKNIYNLWISICLVRKLRGNKKFRSAVELIFQMKKDKKNALEYLDR